MGGRQLACHSCAIPCTYVHENAPPVTRTGGAFDVSRRSRLVEWPAHEQGSAPILELLRLQDEVGRVPEINTVGDRVRDVRKRRGLSQKELAARSGVSASLVKKLEQGDYGDVRLETLHKLAIVLRVPTSALAAGPDAARPEQADVEEWAPVRRALEGFTGGEPAEEPTLEGLKQGGPLAVAAVLDSRYGELQVILPALLRDADTLVAVSVNGTEAEARRLRAQIRQLTAYMIGPKWEFTPASGAIQLAIHHASHRITPTAAGGWKSWGVVPPG